MVACSNRGEEFKQSEFGCLATLIMKQKPVCCYECNKALDQCK